MIPSRCQMIRLLSDGTHRWNQGKCTTRSQQHTGAPHQPPSSKTIRCFRVCIPHKMSPKSLFRCIEDCQEVQILGEDPYTAQQLLKNAVYQLLQSGLYTRDFEDWDWKIATKKIWTNLKTFIQECYTRRLNASSITSGPVEHVDMCKMHSLPSMTKSQMTMMMTYIRSSHRWPHWLPKSTDSNYTGKN